jgi:hypothetical protein
MAALFADRAGTVEPYNADRSGTIGCDVRDCFNEVRTDGPGGTPGTTADREQQTSTEPSEDGHSPMVCREISGREMQVALRRGDLCMPEHHREADDVPAVSKVVGGKRVPQSVPAEARESEPVLQEV